jgi:hypothetical protein
MFTSYPIQKITFSIVRDYVPPAPFPSPFLQATRPYEIDDADKVSRDDQTLSLFDGLKGEQCRGGLYLAGMTQPIAEV